MMVTGGQAKAIQRKGLMMGPGAPRIAVPPHRKLDGSSQLLACKYKASKKRGVCLSREFPKKQNTTWHACIKSHTRTRDSQRRKTKTEWNRTYLGVYTLLCKAVSRQQLLLSVQKSSTAEKARRSDTYTWCSWSSCLRQRVCRDVLWPCSLAMIRLVKHFVVCHGYLFTSHSQPMPSI